MTGFSDVAAGYGEPTLTAARVVGPEGSVVASDISSGMLSYGRERAAVSGLENIEFVESDAISLDLPAQSLDAALSRWGIIFEPDGEGAAARVRGFLKPEARMAIASWGPPERVPMLAVPMMTAMKRLDLPPPPPGRPGPLSRPTPEAIGGLLEGGGFSGIKVDQLDLSMEWDSPEDFTRFVKEIAPPVSNLLKPHPQEVQDETWRRSPRRSATTSRTAGSGWKTWPWSPPAAPNQLELIPRQGWVYARTFYPKDPQKGPEHGCSGEQASSRRGVQGLQQR